MIRQFLCGLGCLCLVGCNGALRQARRAAEGTGNVEMHRVVEAYAGDPERLEAAAFLLENMGEHGTYTFDLVDAVSGAVADYSLYRPEITGSNYRTVLDSLGLAVRYRSESDLEAMTAEYLIRNIDQAFEARERYPWARHYSDTVFLRYVLPYRIDAEELTDWRAFFRARYEPMVDTLAEPRTVRRVARLIIRDIKKQFGFHPEALMLKPAFTPEEAFACGRGECNSVANIYVLALRAMGIAATKDVIPVWGTSDGGHVETVYFDEEGNPVMLDTGEWLAAQPPKIYRVEFARQSEPNVFDEPYYRDVTAEYVATSAPTVAFDSLTDATTGERAALAVFSNERWRPVVLGRETGLPQQYAFHEIGRGILYLPVLTDGQSVRPAGRPFRLDPRGNLDYYDVPDTTQQTTVNLTPLLLPQDQDNWNPDDYYVAYWDRDHWQPTGRPIVQTRGGGADGSATRLYSASGLPSRSIYGIFRHADGRTYHRRIFRNGQGTARRF